MEGGVDRDLIATNTSAQYTPIKGGWERQKLPFYSRFHTNNTAGVDVFSHNVSHMPGSLLFPTTVLGGSSVAHISKCEARAVIVVPNTRAAWFPIIEGAGVRPVQTASQGAGSQFFKVHHQRGAEPYTFGRGGMRALEADLGELYNSYKDNHAPRRDTQHPSTNKQMHTRTRRPITSRPSHRRISLRDAYTHKATSTRIVTSHRRISTRGAHRLTVHDNNTYARPAGSHQVTAVSVHAAHIHTRRPVHASRKSPPNQYTRSTSNDNTR